LSPRDQRLVATGSALLEPHHELIVRTELIDAAATLRAFAEVRRNAGELLVGELTQRKRAERFVTRMIWRGLGHNYLGGVRRAAKRKRRLLIQKRSTDTNLTEGGE
jgi:hypothetical protein